MSLEEKRWWAYTAVVLIVPAIYLAFILSQVASTPVDQIEFQLPLLVAGSTGAVLAVIANIVLRLATDIALPKGAVQQDQRDLDIHRRGEYVAGIILAVAMAVPLGLTMLKAEHFWIAHAMYLALVMWALTSSVVKLVAYRRGF